MCNVATQALNAYFFKQQDPIDDTDQLLRDAHLHQSLQVYVPENWKQSFPTFPDCEFVNAVQLFLQTDFFFHYSFNNLFIQPSYGNTVTSLSILVFLHHIVLNNCMLSNVYTLNLKWLVYISSDKKHVVDIFIKVLSPHKLFLSLSYKEKI